MVVILNIIVYVQVNLFVNSQSILNPSCLASVASPSPVPGPSLSRSQEPEISHQSRSVSGATEGGAEAEDNKAVIVRPNS